MKAYDKGFQTATRGAPQASGRAYESEKANSEYFRGYAEGVRARHPGQMIVECARDGTIFAAYPQEGWNYDVEGNKTPTTHITCPTCARRYFHHETSPEDMKAYPGPGYYSDRKLKILIDK